MLFLRWSRRFHRWISYALGVIVALWVVTGIFMILPPPPPVRVAAPSPIDPSAAARSPNEAARALPAGAQTRVRNVDLREVDGRLVYRFGLMDGEHVLVDAGTAQRIDFTDSLALSLARGAMIDPTVAVSLTRIATHDLQYRFGALPAYRLTLDDSRGTLIHVASDGTVSGMDRRARVRAVMGGLHEFQLPGQRIPNRARKALLIGASVITVVLVLTGYILALPARRRS